MDIIVKNFTDLTEHEIEEWRRLQYGDPTLASPFYCPDFSSAVHRAGKKVKVALASEHDHISGILPFHKGRLGTGIPVGGQISDYQGIIGPLKDNLDTAKFLKACGLRAYDFNHLPDSQSAFAEGSFESSVSPRIDLEDGFDSYFQKRSATSNKELKNTARKFRKLEKDIGPIRFELNDQSEHAWQTLIDWKNQSYDRLKAKSILHTNWVSNTLEKIRSTKNSHFAGMLSTLYVGDNLAAAHFGMRSHNTLHWWFPTYDRSLYKYSPGLVLLIEVAKHVPNAGMTKLDLGRGNQAFKKSFSSSLTQLCEGSVERPFTPAGAARIARKHTHNSLAKVSKLDKVTEAQRRAFNRLLGAVYLPK